MKKSKIEILNEVLKEVNKQVEIAKKTQDLFHLGLINSHISPIRN